MKNDGLEVLGERGECEGSEKSAKKALKIH